MKPILARGCQTAGVIVFIGWLLILTGCATSDADNTSARPWNAPKSWETGVPTGLYEGR